MPLQVLHLPLYSSLGVNLYEDILRTGGHIVYPFLWRQQMVRMYNLHRRSAGGVLADTPFSD